MTAHPGARAAGLLALVFAALGLLGQLDPQADRVALAAVAGLDLALAAAALLLPWHRWGRNRTLLLMVPGFAVVGVCGATGLLPARATGLVFTLAFVWVGTYHSRWSSLWLVGPAAGAYVAASAVEDHGVPLDRQSVAFLVAVWVLVAETIAYKQSRLHSALSELRFLVDNSTDVVARLDDAGTLRYVSPSVTRILGWTPEQMLGRPSSDFRHPDDGSSVDLSRDRVGDTVVTTRRLLHADGSYHWMETTAIAVPTRHGRVEVLSTSRDITDRHRAEQELERRATHDPLTGLPNRDLLDRRLEAVLRSEHADRASVVFVDLDGFKGVNDRHGHAAGDELLQQVADRLRAVTRQDDTVARLGGDEFVLLLKDAPQGNVVAARVEAALSRPYDVAGREVRLSGSVGLIGVQPGATAEELLASADRAMYQHKGRLRATVPTQATELQPTQPAPLG